MRIIHHHENSEGIEEKCCGRCKVWQTLECYVKCKNTWDGLGRVCKGCMKEYRQKNREKLNAYSKEYGKTYNVENKEKIKQHHKEWFQKNKKEVTARMMKRRRENPQVKLKNRLSGRMRDALKGIHKSAKTMELIGCSIDEFKIHIESQFGPGMTWENYPEWHLDHKIPCKSFNLADPLEQRICFHFSNISPMWGDENISKGAKVNKEDVGSLKEKLTPEIKQRLEKLAEESSILKNEREQKLDDGMLVSFREFWRKLEDRRGFYHKSIVSEKKKFSTHKKSQEREREKQKHRDNLEKKPCKKCGVEKAISEFYKNKATYDGLQHMCKNCNREDTRKRREAKKNKPTQEKSS